MDEQHYYFIGGSFWQIIAMGFYKSLFTINPVFLFAYVYGFFANFLFGGIFYFLPKLFNQRPMGSGTMKVHFLLLNVGTLMGAIFEYLEKYSNVNFTWVFNLLSAIVWLIAFLIFFFWFGDFLYKVGLNPSLIGVSIGMLMYALFLFDSFVGAILPNWVELRHVHVMFVGTLVITISSVGGKIIKMESGSLITDQATWDAQMLIKHLFGVRSILMFFVIIGSSMVLFFFTLREFEFAGYAGIFLFFSFLCNQILVLRS